MCIHLKRVNANVLCQWFICSSRPICAAKMCKEEKENECVEIKLVSIFFAFHQNSWNRHKKEKKTIRSSKPSLFIYAQIHAKIRRASGLFFVINATWQDFSHALKQTRSEIAFLVLFYSLIKTISIILFNHDHDIRKYIDEIYNENFHHSSISCLEFLEMSSAFEW